MKSTSQKPLYQKKYGDLWHVFWKCSKLKLRTGSYWEFIIQKAVVHRNHVATATKCDLRQAHFQNDLSSSASMRAIMLVISDRRLCKNKHMKTDVVVPKNLYVYVYFDIVQTFCMFTKHRETRRSPRKPIPDIGDLLEPCPIGLTAHLASRWTCMLLEQRIKVEWANRTKSMKAKTECCIDVQDETWLRIGWWW